MRPRCEVCESFHPNAEFGDGYRVVEVQFDVRVVHLCVAHARIAKNSGVDSFEGLRQIYGESEGRRSFVPRRGASAPRANDERRSPGRRASDAAPRDCE
jgi:hypothetical protein